MRRAVLTTWGGSIAMLIGCAGAAPAEPSASAAPVATSKSEERVGRPTMTYEIKDNQVLVVLSRATECQSGADGSWRECGRKPVEGERIYLWSLRGEVAATTDAEGHATLDPDASKDTPEMFVLGKRGIVRYDQSAVNPREQHIDIDLSVCPLFPKWKEMTDAQKARKEASGGRTR